jgi:hypothetical protein
MSVNKQILGLLKSCTNPHTVKSALLRFVFVTLLTTHYSLLFSQVTATFMGDSSKIEIGDHLNMKLVVNAQPGYLVDFPKFTGDTIGKLDIISKGKIDTATLSGNTIYSQTVTISAYEEGQYFFNPSKIYFLNKAKGTVDSVFTNDWKLTVTTLPVDTTKPIKPIKAPLKVPYVLAEYIWYLVGALVFILAGIIAYFIYRRYKNKPAAVVTRPRPKEPAHIWATKELRKLEQEKLWQKDEVKLYHSRLTDILRSYLEYRFEYYAMEATTEEIMTEAGKLDIGMDAGARLREILRLADFVKFAKMNPAPDQNTKSLQDAFIFVDMTKPKEEVVENINKQKK